ncbi:MAG: hypothetical protein ACRYGK_03900, partial [Janthinobacterium lividum]
MNLLSLLIDTSPTVPEQKKAVQPAHVTFIKPHVYAAAAKQAVPPPAQPQRPQQHVIAPRTERQNRRVRDGDASQREDSTLASASELEDAAAEQWLENGSRSDSQSQQEQGSTEEHQEEKDDAPSAGKTRSAAEMEMQEMASCLPMGNCNGIFDVTMPDGETLGVVVDSNAKRTTYMLTPGSPKGASNLIKNQKELNACLERRIGRDVQLIIL